MKAALHNKEVLLTLRPLELAAYLRAHYWQETEHQPGRYSVWYHNGDGDPIEILLPLNREFRDYAARIADVMQTLEATEERPQIEILADIQAAACDVIQIAAEAPDLQNGTIALTGGMHFIAHARQSLLAVACSTVQTRAVYHSRKPPAALDYIEQARFGLARGSFAMHVYAPMPPTWPAAEAGDLEPPFARRVSRQFIQAVRSLSQITEQAAVAGDISPFFDAVEDGISANLCDALAGLYESSGAELLRFDVKWSPLLPESAQQQVPVRISADMTPLIREAGRVLRATSVRKDFNLEGLIVRLEQDPYLPSGHVTISAEIDEVQRRVELDLDNENYQHAIEAHRKRLTVRCYGDLVREGPQYILRNPRDFAVVAP